jgi:hypothetical protein
MMQHWSFFGLTKESKNIAIASESNDSKEYVTLVRYGRHPKKSKNDNAG